MIKKIVFTFGLTMTVGTGVVAFDLQNAAPSNDDPAFDLLLKMENWIADQTRETGPWVDGRRAALPQTSSQGAPEKEWWEMSGEEELRAIAKHNPQVRDYIDRLDADRRDAGWARVRHKARNAAQGQSRLGNIHKRETVDGTTQEVTWEEWDRMGTLDKVRHRSSIKKPDRSGGQTSARQGSGIIWEKKRD